MHRLFVPSGLVREDCAAKSENSGCLCPGTLQTSCDHIGVTRFGISPRAAAPGSEKRWKNEQRLYKAEVRT